VALALREQPDIVVQLPTKGTEASRALLDLLVLAVAEEHAPRHSEHEVANN
jgi:hypothetical protein